MESFKTISKFKKCRKRNKKYFYRLLDYSKKYEIKFK
nr:MAG TPA: hypothetical protein [Caudoviricetes sp.]